MRTAAFLMLPILFAGFAIGAEPAVKWGDAARTGHPFAKDPSVVRFQGHYLLYYTMAPWDAKLAPAGAPKGCAIGIARSDDLVAWTKVGELLPEQECEQNGIVAGRVVLVDGVLHLFYGSDGNGEKDAICHATSSDGLRFTRDASNPIWRGGAGWNDGRATGVEAVAWQESLILYYGTRDPGGRIGLLHGISASVHSDFSRAEWSTLIDSPIFKPETAWEHRSVEQPSALVRGATVYLFYTGGNEAQAIGCATSTDGIHLQRQFVDQPLLPSGASGSWNSSSSAHPSVFTDDGGQQYLFFEGSNDRGRTWCISWVKLGWKADRPSITP